MFAQLTMFPEQASTGAHRVDLLLLALVSVTVFFTLLIAAVIFYFAIRYRRRSSEHRPPRIVGSLKLELTWTFIPAVIAMGIFLWSVSVYFYLTRPPSNAEEIYVVAKQWMWKIQHRGGQREINELHVPAGTPIKLTLTSEDVIHSFFVPAFRVKADVLPNRYVHTWFEAVKPGTYPLFCSQYCGTGHSDMTGWVVVMEPDDYDAWLAGQAEGSLALEGRKLLRKYQCISCHSADANARGPVLERLYGSPVMLNGGGTVIADETYLRESILDPDAKITAGFQSIMPTFEGQIDEQELIALIEYIKSLGPGQTPRRVDEAQPPTADRAASPDEATDDTPQSSKDDASNKTKQTERVQP
jgi:cytochrome c oxidase subunit II